MLPLQAVEAEARSTVSESIARVRIRELAVALAANGRVVDHTDEVKAIDLYPDRMTIEFMPMHTGIEGESKIEARAKWGVLDIPIELNQRTARGDESVIATLTISWPSLQRQEVEAKLGGKVRRLLPQGSGA